MSLGPKEGDTSVGLQVNLHHKALIAEELFLRGILLQKQKSKTNGNDPSRPRIETMDKRRQHIW